MSEPVEHSLDRLGLALRGYMQLSGKTPEETLSKKGRDFTFALSARFSDVRDPNNTPGHRTRIVNKAKSLEWALAKVSPRAAELADELMGGKKSVVGRVTVDGDRITIRTARVGKRGRRITGGRKARGGSAASLAQYRAEGFDRLEGETVLNRRAVIVAIATMLRMRGSGSLAVSFLYRQWRKGARGSFTLEHVNPKAQVKLQGTAAFRGGEAPSLTITSKMPGVGKFPGAVDRAVDTIVEDIRNYIPSANRQSGQQAGLKVT